MPLDRAAMRSGTESCFRLELPCEPVAVSDAEDRLPEAATPGGGFTVKPKGSPPGPVRAPAGPAKPASVTPAVAVTANSWTIRHQGLVRAARSARRWDRSSTMYKTI